MASASPRRDREQPPALVGDQQIERKPAINSAKLWLLISPRPKLSPEPTQSSQRPASTARPANSREAQVNSASGASVVMNRLVSARPGDRSTAAPLPARLGVEQAEPARNTSIAASAVHQHRAAAHAQRALPAEPGSSRRSPRPARAASSSSRTRVREPSRCIGLRPRTYRGRRRNGRPAATPPPAQPPARAEGTRLAGKDRAAGRETFGCRGRTRSVECAASAGARSRAASSGGSETVPCLRLPCEPAPQAGTGEIPVQSRPDRARTQVCKRGPQRRKDAKTQKVPQLHRGWQPLTGPPANCAGFFDVILCVFAAPGSGPGHALRRGSVVWPGSFLPMTAAPVEPLTNQRALAVLTLIAVLASFFFLLGRAPLFDVDEGAFSQATMEMFERGDFLSTYLNGQPRYDKPILVYWLQAAAVATLGASELAFRLPSALCASLWALFTFLFARRCFGWQRALLAAAVLATSLGVYIIGRAATADALLNLLIAASMFARLAAPRHRPAQLAVCDLRCHRPGVPGQGTGGDPGAARGDLSVLPAAPGPRRPGRVRCSTGAACCCSSRSRRRGIRSSSPRRGGLFSKASSCATTSAASAARCRATPAA